MLANNENVLKSSPESSNMSTDDSSNEYNCSSPPSQANEDINNNKRKKTMFTKEEDKRLVSIINECGDKDWGLIASIMGNRTRRQCRERWKKFLCPSINNTPWTKEEDKLLLNEYQKFGPKWSLISRSFKNRTDICIKTRYIVLTRRIQKQQDLIMKASKISASLINSNWGPRMNEQQPINTSFILNEMNPFPHDENKKKVEEKIWNEFIGKYNYKNRKPISAETQPIVIPNNNSFANIPPQNNIKIQNQFIPGDIFNTQVYSDQKLDTIDWGDIEDQFVFTENDNFLFV